MPDGSALVPDGIALSSRPATSADLEFLAASHRSGHEAVADVRGGRLDILLRGRPEPVDVSFQTSIDDDASTVLIGEVDGVPVGYLVAVIASLRSDELMASVTDLWVHPEARGVGVGAMLMREASGLATQQGCVGIDARALPGDRVTKNFFESFGLVARTIEVHKTL